jgi:hypothetical protein
MLRTFGSTESEKSPASRAFPETRLVLGKVLEKAVYRPFFPHEFRAAFPKTEVLGKPQPIFGGFMREARQAPRRFRELLAKLL